MKEPKYDEFTDEDEADKNTFVMSYRLPQKSRSKGKPKGVAVVEGKYEVESQAILSEQTNHDVVADPKNPPEAITIVYPNKQNRKARKVFIVCFISQLITIGLFVAFLLLRWRSDGASANGGSTTMVVVGVNDTAANGNQQGNEYGFNAETDDDCVSTIKVDKSCYALGEGIFVDFVNCKPSVDDWVGIYFAENVFAPGVYRVSHWMWACGDQDCQEIAFGGNMTFEHIDTTGTFKAHLHRKTGTPKEMYLASSEEFRIEEHEWDC